MPRKTQLKFEQEQSIRQDWIFAKMFLAVFDIQTGKATEDEIEEVRKFLELIENHIITKLIILL